MTDNRDWKAKALDFADALASLGDGLTQANIEEELCCDSEESEFILQMIIEAQDLLMEDALEDKLKSL